MPGANAIAAQNRSANTGRLAAMLRRSRTAAIHRNRMWNCKGTRCSPIKPKLPYGNSSAYRIFLGDKRLVTLLKPPEVSDRPRAGSPQRHGGHGVNRVGFRVQTTSRKRLTSTIGSNFVEARQLIPKPLCAPCLCGEPSARARTTSPAAWLRAPEILPGC
jgi:hypothetical protein